VRSRVDRAETERKRSPAYDRYAAVYDKIGQSTFGEHAAEATLAHLIAHGARPASVIDLACGTGAATLVFARAGLRTIGVDLSRSMLTKAIENASAAGLTIDFIEDDVRSFVAREPVDLVTCFYDALNYLVTPTELESACVNAYASLTPGGYFVFDLNTRAKFASSWNESCFVAADREDLFGIYQSWYEHETGISPLMMTFFVRALDGSWERFDEEHVERAYVLSDVREMLAKIGFEQVQMLDYSDRSPRFGPPGTERSHRVVFVVRRPLEGAAEPGMGR
jgi:SAM-dependent methyltransferase